MDAHPGLAPGASVLQADGSTLRHVRDLKAGLTNRTCTGTAAFTGRDANCYNMVNIGKWLPSVDLHHDDPVNSRACCFDMTGDGPSARYCAAVFHLSSGCSAIELRRMWMKMVARPGAAPGASSLQTRRVC